GRSNDLAFGGFVANSQHGRKIQTEQRGHRADTDRYSFLHVTSPAAHEGSSLTQRQRTRSNQRRVLAEAVAGNEVGPDSLFLEDAIYRDRCRNNRRLRILCEF